MELFIDSAFAVAEWKRWMRQVEEVKSEIAMWNRNLKELPEFQHNHCRMMIKSLEHELDGLMK